MIMQRAAALILVICLIPAGLPAQTEGDTVTPEPYQPEEFPGWAHDLRRWEIIAFGVVPVSLILTHLTYDVVRFGVKSAQAGEFDREFAPWFFAPPGVERFSPGEKETILLTSVAVSVVFAVVDYALGRRQRKAQSAAAGP